MSLCVVACVHGDELFGLKVLELLRGEKIKRVIANREAIKVGKRFIDTDLNRSFPGNASSNSYEERRAHELMSELGGYEVIDLHSSSSNTPPFAIITNTRPETIALAKSTGVKRICLMTPELAKGKSLIDNVGVGVSLEMGRHDDPLIIVKAREFIINALNGFESNHCEFYRVTGVETDMSVEAEDFVFNGKYYPVLVGEAAYKGVKCLKAEKVNFF